MLEGFTAWLEQSDLTATFSDTTRTATWLIIPTSQSIHLVCVAVVMISVALINLRLLGIAGNRQGFAQLTAHLMPWVWTALIVLAITGTIQTIAEPGRELLNIGFRTKMVMIAITVAIMMVYESTIKKDPRYWDHSAKRRRYGRILAAVSLVLWLGIVVAGRLIAYVDTRPEI
jgi:uncharacterized membrane protein